MRFRRISQEQAEKIIIFGKGAGFSAIKLVDTNFMVYHRMYKGRFYNVAQKSIYDNSKEEFISVFYILDNNEVKSLLGTDPEECFEA